MYRVYQRFNGVDYAFKKTLHNEDELTEYLKKIRFTGISDIKKSYRELNKQFFTLIFNMSAEKYEIIVDFSQADIALNYLDNARRTITGPHYRGYKNVFYDIKRLRRIQKILRK